MRERDRERHSKTERDRERKKVTEIQRERKRYVFLAYLTFTVSNNQ